METPPEPPPDEGTPAKDEAQPAHGPPAQVARTLDDGADSLAAQMRRAAAEVSGSPIDDAAADEAPAAVRPKRTEVDVAPPIDVTAPDVPPVAEVLPAAEAPKRVEEAPREVARATATAGRRWLKVAAGVAGVLIGGGAAVALLLPGYVRGRIDDEARALGVALTYDDVDVGFTSLKLEGVKLSLAGVPDMEAQAQRIEVDLDDWQPRAVRARGLSMSLAGTSVLDQLAAWKSANPKALAAPLTAESATVEWRPAKGTDTAVSLSEARVSVDPSKGSIDAGQSVFLGRAAGPASVGWATEGGGVTVEIRPKAAPLSAIAIDVTQAKDASKRERPQVKITLARTALGPLQAALGAPKGSEGLEAEGELTMPLPSLEQPAPIEGSVKLSVKGYVPPHPRELDGILFGNVTKVRSDFKLDPDFGKAKLSQVQVEAGALALRGLGDVERDGFDATVALTLKGTIPCSALATSAAVAHLGREWGKLAGGLASGTVRGNVSVVLMVEAKASDLQGARIDKSARLNCKVGVPGLPSIVIR